MDALRQRFPARDTLIQELIFKLNSHWPLLFVHGHRGTGKSSIVQEVLLSQPGVRTSVQDLREGCSVKDIFTRALLDYSVPCSQPIFDQMVSCSCSDVSSFVEKIKQIAKGERFIIVLDSAEVLLQSDPSLMNCICKLHELVRHHLQLTVILISCLPFHNFLRPGVAHFQPLVVHFKSYTREQLLLILRSRSQPNSFSKEFYENYTQLVLSVLFDVTRNVAEIAFVCDTNFEAYTDPIRRGEVQERESAKLWRLFEPRLRHAASSIALKGKTMDSVTEEMPLTMKLLLIAAFLCSFNSKASDKRFFVKTNGRRKISRRVNHQTQRSGPKAFPMERLLHVYASILQLNFVFDKQDSGIVSEQRLKCSNELFALVEDLLSLKLLTRVGLAGSTISSVKKWRISDCVTYEYISGISESIQFDLHSHMEEFAFKK
jgi:hypothetical protein